MSKRDGVVTKSNRIFVFGSNLAGRHGAGSALEAVKSHGARYGQGTGIQGRSYAIPTKDVRLRQMPLDQIKSHVDWFLHLARTAYPFYEFDVVAIGCGLAGYKPEQIGPMFKGASNNVHLPPEFEQYR